MILVEKELDPTFATMQANPLRVALGQTLTANGAPAKENGRSKYNPKLFSYPDA